MELTGKVAIVTGGAAGMGKGIAIVLAGYGAIVAVADINEALAAGRHGRLNLKAQRPPPSPWTLPIAFR